MRPDPSRSRAQLGESEFDFSRHDLLQAAMVHQGTPKSALCAAGPASQVALQHRRPRPIGKEPEGFNGGAEQGNDLACRSRWPCASPRCLP
jgi:hypothetical protein